MTNKQGNFKNQMCVLRVHIHCDGCKKKVKKLLQRIEGVDATMIDAELGKVTVSGYVHPNTLIKKLEKSGKHAELWAAPKNSPYAAVAQNRVGNQFHDVQFGNLSKPHKGHPKDMKLKPKTVKFDLAGDDFAGSDRGFSESENDGFELGFGRRPGSRTPARSGNGGLVGNKGSQKNGRYEAVKNGGGKSKKKRGIFGIRLLFFKGFGRKKKGKNCCTEKKKNNKKGSNGGGATGGGCMKKGDIEFKTGGKNGGWAVENGKKGKVGGVPVKNGGNNGQVNGGKYGGRGGGKNADFQELDFGNNYRKSGGGGGGGGRGGGSEFAGSVAPMGPIGNHSMGPIGNYNYPMSGNNSMGPMGPYSAAGQMGNYQAVPGLPAAAPMNAGGYYPGGMGAMNHHHHQQQQQLMNMNMNMMMMSQAHAHPNMYQPTMYARPHPVAGYAPHRASDGYSNMFNDENTESCTIM